MTTSDNVAAPVDTSRVETDNAIVDYTYAQKAEFATKMHARLSEINRDLDHLSHKIERANDDAKAEGKPKLQSVRDQVTRMNVELDNIKHATESTWIDVKAGFRKGYSELKDGFHQARQWVNGKIAP